MRKILFWSSYKKMSAFYLVLRYIVYSILRSTPSLIRMLPLEAFQAGDCFILTRVETQPFPPGWSFLPQNRDEWIPTKELIS